MDNNVIITVIISFLISAVLCPIIIPFLKRLKFGQFVREDGPQEHLKKSGTPTMGGLIFLAAIIITLPFFVREATKIIPVLILTLGLGLIGFLDDYIKVVKKRSMGLRAWQKMAGQLVVTGIFAYYILYVTKIGTEMLIPFTGGRHVDLGWWFIPVLFIVVLGTANGSNFTDGLDGLESSVTAVIAGFITIVSAANGAGIEVLGAAVVGSLLGFLTCNVYPAKIFMGDTGSLALGGFVAGSAYMLQMPFIIVIIAFIYLAEVISVMMQVTYFKITGGKRIFKMAPIHHHFELCGWSETKVVGIFTILTIILCLLAYVAI
ncbi:phospho-N-acetylmuramoyl-pentapeptide-transferase [Parasporobacterium paucivorans]|uniref:Phospho-N-acetylmuramoyl-pentapeptide-transferase n=1 Tax=Parasporobacterium paucivorans DSM 15970 TaxID=1122934 RepID=A0A1M6G2T7_9FIRM|nr:phospho-N-acetylmuramoyl-pentapeptide-transferase [Parasporobacterium paucivorans]SHJ04276.1 Phospho-N-acetylmuramoyl-pentapeptide-transferase [Parasporobacterium paucivorans DSM 15970]